MLHKFNCHSCILFVFRPPRNLDSKATIKINDKQFEIEASDLQLIQNLGRGAFGIVDKMMHRPSGAILAVKVVNLWNSINKKQAKHSNGIHMKTVYNT